MSGDEIFRNYSNVAERLSHIFRRPNSFLDPPVKFNRTQLGGVNNEMSRDRWLRLRGVCTGTSAVGREVRGGGRGRPL